MPGNFGDLLTPWLLRKMGHDPLYRSNSQNGKLFCIGSLLHYVKPGDTVWGTGAMWSTTRPPADARYCAVRGPRTRRCIIEAGGECPEIYGDPALLASRFYRPNAPKTHALGVMPHYIDAGSAEVADYLTAHTAPRTAWPSVLLINPLSADVQQTIDQICACERIISSSLHGLIVAESYGIPWQWHRFGDRLCGDDTKFHDFFESLNSFDADALLAAFPHEAHHETADNQLCD